MGRCAAAAVLAALVAAGCGSSGARTYDLRIVLPAPVTTPAPTAAERRTARELAELEAAHRQEEEAVEAKQAAARARQFDAEHRANVRKADREAAEQAAREPAEVRASEGR